MLRRGEKGASWVWGVEVGREVQVRTWRSWGRPQVPFILVRRQGLALNCCAIFQTLETSELLCNLSDA